MADYSVLDFGGKGDGASKDTASIQAAIDRCNAGGGGRVIFRSGHTFLSGTISVKSNVELHVERGATLLASPDEADHIAKMERRDRRAFITAEGHKISPSPGRGSSTAMAGPM